jgi:hypothetical protein
MSEPLSDAEKVSALWTAIAQAQSKLGPVPKNGRNPHFRTKYATLDDILKTTLPVFASVGIGITQWSSTSETGVRVKTIIGHQAGASVQDMIELPCDTSNPQKVGSTLTYARRYALQSALGIAAEEDDDANASAIPSNPVPTRTKPVGQARKVPGNKPQFDLGDL